MCALLVLRCHQAQLVATLAHSRLLPELRRLTPALSCLQLAAIAGQVVHQTDFAHRSSDLLLTLTGLGRAFVGNNAFPLIKASDEPGSLFYPEAKDIRLYLQ